MICLFLFNDRKEVQLKKLKNEALKVEADLKRLGPGKIESENAAREEAIVLRRARQELSQVREGVNLFFVLIDCFFC